MTKQAEWFHFGLGEAEENDPTSCKVMLDKTFSLLKDSFQRAGQNYKSELKQYWDKRNKTSEHTKTAALPGGPDVGELEHAFEAIASQQIRTRVPLLMPYYLGFQLLKKTDDDTRACGIFAFKAGDELVYIPVFSINGEIQGYELMYLVSRDQFIPSDEKHVNYLLSRKPIEPGKIELRDRSEIASRTTTGDRGYLSGLKLSAFQHQRLSRAIVEDALRRIFKGAAASAVEETPRYRFAVSQLSLPELFELSSRSVKRAEMWSRKYPIYDRLLHYALDGQKVQDYSEKWAKLAGIAKQMGIRAQQPQTLQEYLMQGMGMWLARIRSTFN